MGHGINIYARRLTSDGEEYDDTLKLASSNRNNPGLYISGNHGRFKDYWDYYRLQGQRGVTIKRDLERAFARFDADKILPRLGWGEDHWTPKVNVYYYNLLQFYLTCCEYPDGYFYSDNIGILYDETDLEETEVTAKAETTS